MKKKKPEMTFTKSALKDRKKECTTVAMRRSASSLLLAFDGKKPLSFMNEDCLEEIVAYVRDFDGAESFGDKMEVYDDYREWAADAAEALAEVVFEEYPDMRYMIVEGEIDEPGCIIPSGDTEEHFMDVFLSDLRLIMMETALEKRIHAVIFPVYCRGLGTCVRCGTDNDIEIGRDGKGICPHCGEVIDGDLISLILLHRLGERFIEGNPGLPGNATVVS